MSYILPKWENCVVLSKDFFIFIYKLKDISLRNHLTYLDLTFLSSSSLRITLVWRFIKVILLGFLPSKFFLRSISVYSRDAKKESNSTFSKVDLILSRFWPTNQIKFKKLTFQQFKNNSREIFKQAAFSLFMAFLNVVSLISEF